MNRSVSMIYIFSLAGGAIWRTNPAYNGNGNLGFRQSRLINIILRVYVHIAYIYSTHSSPATDLQSDVLTDMTCPKIWTLMGEHASEHFPHEAVSNKHSFPDNMHENTGIIVLIILNS